MYDKTVRRRRAVLGLLVACSLILLTAYFGESAGGNLHAIQRGATEVLNPIQEGASRALKPVRDLFGWFGDTIDAKGDVEDLRAERNALRTELIREEGATAEADRLRALLELRTSLGLEEYGPITGRVIQQSPTVWYRRVTVNLDATDGVSVGDPVLNEQALIGQVTQVSDSSAQITLITDASSAVTARAASKPRSFGIVQPASAGNPNDLLVEFTSGTGRFEEGDRVVTRGTVSDTERLESLFPPGLPIGEISRIDDPGTDTEEIHLRPFADMRGLEFVQILTEQPRGNRQ